MAGKPMMPSKGKPMMSAKGKRPIIAIMIDMKAKPTKKAAKR